MNLLAQHPERNIIRLQLRQNVMLKKMSDVERDELAPLLRELAEERAVGGVGQAARAVEQAAHRLDGAALRRGDDVVDGFVGEPRHQPRRAAEHHPVGNGAAHAEARRRAHQVRVAGRPTA
mgnify:CR=1 FL=1